jgi:allophanate hydrolase
MRHEKGGIDSLSRLRAQYLSGASTVPDVAARVITASSRPEHAEAWIHRVPEEALLAEARRLQDLPDAEKARLPLFGVPFAVKDNIDVAGVPTTAACPDFAHVPAVSAPAVRRLLDAGALFVGKTNMDQFATGLVGVRSPYGACKNPFDPRYITGGSSSGSALAVAAGMVVFALGTDTAGSGRVPAAFTSIVGVKPTKGRVSTRGVVPACPSLDCVTVFAREAADAFAVLRVMEGFDAADPWSRRIPEAIGPSAGVGTKSGFKVGVPVRGQLDFSGDSAYEALYGEAAEKMRSLGATLVAVDVEPLLECARLLYSGPWLAERAEAIAGSGTFGAAHPEALLPLLRTILDPAKDLTAMDAFRGFGKLQSLRRAAEPLWDSVDFLLMPTTPTIFTHEEVAAEPLRRNADLGRFTNFVNLMDLSAVALPAGFRTDGLPFGVTVLAPAFGEDALERVAALWEGGRDAASANPDSGSRAASRTSLLVFGLHLSGMPLNHELTTLGATLERTVKTSPSYRMALIKRGEKRLPGVWRQKGPTGIALEGEVWSLPDENVGAFFARVPAPLCLGSVELDDGSWVKGFLGEAFACESAEDISRYGGWRGWTASL